MPQALKWFFFICFLGVAVFLYFFGLNPKPVAQIQPTAFERSEQIGAVVYRRLFQDFRELSIVILGSSPFVKDYEQVWAGLLRTFQADQKNLALPLQDAGMRRLPVVYKSVSIDLIADEERLVAYIRDALKRNEKVIIHTSVNRSLQRFPSDLIQHLEKEFQQPILSLSQAKMVVQAQQESQVQPPCNEAQEKDALSALSCWSLSFSRRFYRKHLDSSLIYAAMEKHGHHDYVLYIYQP